MSAGSPGPLVEAWTLPEITERCSELHAVAARLFTIVGAWSAEDPDHAGNADGADHAGNADGAATVAFATLSRMFGEHSQWWSEYTPESVLLSDRRDRGAASTIVASAAALADAVHGARVERLAAVLDLVARRVGELGLGCRDEAGAPFRRVASWAAADLAAGAVSVGAILGRSDS